MSDQFVQVQADSTGKKIDTTETMVGLNLVERQRVHIAGTAAGALIEPISSAPVGTEVALPVRNIPSGIQDTRTTLVSIANIVDTTNSSVTPLLANGVFTGTWVDVLNYNQIVVMVFANQVGTLTVQFSSNGTDVDHSHTYPTVINVGETFSLPLHTRYARVVFTNSNVGQTVFRLQSILKIVPLTSSILDADDNISANDDCLVTKSIITGQSTLDGKYISGKMTPDGGMLINQNITIDPANSSVVNLAGGATFTGVGTNNLTATGLQVFLKTDQNCTVFVEQSQDGTYWDTSDPYYYYASIGNFALNVDAVGTFYRVRVTNTSSIATTIFRLQSIMVPIHPTLPRTLSQDGYLQVAVQASQDATGFASYNTPFGEQLSVPLYRLLGSTFNGNILDTNFWTAAQGTGGTVGPVDGQLSVLTGTTVNNSVSLSSVHAARFSTGSPNKFRHVMRLGDSGVVNNIRRWGAMSTTDGAFFELNGTTLSVGTRKAGVDTKFSSGSFNGKLGSTFFLDTSPHSYEIVVNSFRIWFYIDKKLLHTLSPTSSWSATLDLPIRIENTNINNLATNVALYVYATQILRMGLPSTQPVSSYISGITAGTTLKLGAGNLIGLVVGDNSGSITIYDNTTATGRIVSALTPSSVGSVDFKGVVFSNGLTVVTTGLNSKWTLIYE